MAKRNVPEFVASAEFISKFWIALWTAIQELGGTAEDIYNALKEDSPLVKEFARLAIEAGRKARNTFHLLVNSDRSVEDGVKAGRYDWSNSDINSSNFPSNRKGKTEEDIYLIHFDKVMSTDTVLAELDKMGLRSAGIQHALAFGEKYLDVQREFPIIFLASVWQYPSGSRRCPVLIGSDVRRDLHLHWLDVVWGGGDRFAAVSK